MIFTTKADTLAFLAGNPELAIPPLTSFAVERWRTDPAGVLREVAVFFPQGNRVAVRSSCRREDSAEASGAGAYLSLLHVDAHDSDALTSAIGRVIASYADAVASVIFRTFPIR